MRRAMLAVALGAIACSSDHMGSGPVASRLVFSVQPSAATAGVVLAPAVQVTALDDAGAVVSSFSGTITIALATNPGSATLAGTLTKGAVDGVATFSDLRLNRTGTGYSFRVTSGALTAVTSGTFSISAAPAQQLAFLVQPTDAVAGSAIAPAVQVQARDSLGNLAPSFTDSVSLVLTTNAGGAVLAGATTVSAVAGVATFSALHVDKSGSGFTMLATATSLTQATSNPFAVSPAAPVRLKFAVQPSAATAGVAIAPPVQVTALDAYGNTATGFGGSVSLSIGVNPGGGSLSGTIPVTAVNGMASFTDLSLANAGSGYTLVASTAGLAGDTSTAFTISAAGVSVSHSSILASPAAITASGGSSAATITVTAKDQFDNPIAGRSVTLAVSGSGNALVPAGLTQATNAAGQATWTFSSTIAEAKTISATIDGAAIAQTATVTVSAGSVSANQATVAAAPSGITACNTGCSAGAGTASLITVTAKDQFGNPIPGASVTVSVSGGGNTLAPASLTQTTGSTGQATWTLSSAVTETKTISATINSVAIAQTGTVTVTTTGVSGTQSTLTAAPASIAACGTSCSFGGGTASLITVTALDQFGNPVPGSSVTLGVSGAGNTLSPAGLTQTANGAGQATWTLNSTVAAAKTISATINGVAITQTATVTVSATGVSASQSTVAAAPGSITACNSGCSDGGGTASVVTVTAKDQFGNPVQGAAVVLATTGAGNTISQPGATGQTGVTTAVLSSTVAGVKTVTATVNGVLLSQAPIVTVVAGPVSAAQSTVKATQDTIEASNGAITTGITVTARDAFGNPITGAAISVAATGTGVTVASPTGTSDATGVYGGATLSATIIGAKVASAMIGGVAITQKDTVTVQAGEVSTSQSTIAASPSTVLASSGSGGATITVTARDDQGNPIAGIAVVLAATGTGNALIQPVGGTNASGVATGTIRSTKAEAKTVSATIGGTGIVQTASVTVTPAAASTLAFTQQPTSATVSTAISPPIKVEVRDQFGNVVDTATKKVVLSIGTNPGGGTLTGGDSVLPSSGVSTFSAASIDKAGTGYTLVAGAAGITARDTSSAFNIISGAVSATNSLVGAAPATITASTGSSLSTITVTARDASLNPVQGATVALTVTGTGYTLTPSGPLTTDPSGVATATLSSTAAGIKTVSAQINGVAILQQASVSVNAASISGAVSTLLASPGAIVQTSGVSTITVTAKDPFGNPVSGASVTLAATGTGNVLTPPSAPTGSNGITTGTLSSTVVGNKVITAVAGGVSLTHSDTVAVTPLNSSVVLVGAGDIAVCNKVDDDSTAAVVTGVLNSTPGAEVFTLGDNAYPDGTTSDFSNCYDSTWGAFKAETHPSAGNHDYNTAGAAPYFAYFGAAAGDPAQGYYSYDIGAWHVIVLNSEIATSAGSPQVQWLQADLAAHPNVCTLAYWHEPLYSSVGGTTGTTGATISSIQPFWDALYAAGADLVLNGHRHVYERLARMAPDGSPDPTNGIREIIVGTGGDSGGDLTNIFPTSEVRNGRTYGVIKLTLFQSSYSWQFMPAEGATFTDSGTESCH